ncbi:MAG: cyclase family protein [Bacteroidetes bacterium]|nr:cyclase family protein [Bacteroidota bacterium]
MFDLSIPVEFGRPRAWYLDGPRREAVRLGEWVGDVNQGGSVNFFDVHFNPHAHGTHTESVGHVVSESVHAVSLPLPPWMRARVVRIPSPRLLRLEVLQASSASRFDYDALVLATHEGDLSQRDWRRSDPPAVEPAALAWLAEHGVRHLLIDLPSVDPEEDGGALAAHRAFWGLPLGSTALADARHAGASITELIQVPADCAEGNYMLNLSLAPMHGDAVPSRPILFPAEST